MSHQIIPVTKKEDIPEEYRDTPIGLLLEYHNLGRPYEEYSQAQLLVGMCMDNRKHLHIPDNFSYIIRSGGANLRYSEFKISYAVAVGGVSHIALIGHNNCGMVGLKGRKEAFIEGLVERAGWIRQDAREHFDHFAPMFALEDEVDFIVAEQRRLSKKYPKIQVAALYYQVESRQLSFIQS